MSFLLCLCFWLLVLAPSLAHSAMLENPGPNSFQSGIGVLSGWVCDADRVEIVLDSLPSQVAAYGTERLDTAGVCGDTDNGFGLLFNWNRLGDGVHTVRAFADGVEFGQATFTVTTLGGEEFVRGASANVSVQNFPVPGETAHFVWNEGTQHLELNDPPTSRLDDLLGTWWFTTTYRGEEHTDNMGEEHTDDWMFSTTRKTFDDIPIATGLAESRYHAQGGYIPDVARDLELNCEEYDYAVYWVSSLSCNILAFNLEPSKRKGSGIRAFARPDVLRYFYNSLENSHVNKAGEWLALTNAPNASAIDASTTIKQMKEEVWHFTLSYQDVAGVGHAPYYEVIAATNYGGIPETDYRKWTIDIGEVRLEWDIVAASESIIMDEDGTAYTLLAVNVRPGARVRDNRDGLPFPPPDLDQEVGEAMSVVQVIKPYSCGPYVIYRPEENDVMTTVKRTRLPRLVSEAEQQDGAALLRAVEAVCRPE